MSAREGEEVIADQILGKASGWGSLARYVTDHDSINQYRVGNWEDQSGCQCKGDGSQ